MDKGSISQISQSIQRQVENKFRRSLKEVQPSADEGRIVQTNMIFLDDKTSLKVKQSKSVGKVIVPEKENVPAIRRSKRKAAAEKVTYVESPVEQKPPKAKNTQVKKVVTKSKKGRPVASKKNEQKTGLNQTKIKFAPVTTDVANEIASVSQSGKPEKQLTGLMENNEDSGFDPTCGASDQSNPEKQLTGLTEVSEDSGFDPTCDVSGQSIMNSTVILRTPNVEKTPITAITADGLSLEDWKDLADQKTIALEKALYENELLHDQLEVLQTENSQLKELLKEAEHIAEVIETIIN